MSSLAKPAPGSACKPEGDKSWNAITAAAISASAAGDSLTPPDASYKFVSLKEVKGVKFVKLIKDGKDGWWVCETASATGEINLREAQFTASKADGTKIINGLTAAEGGKLRQIGNMETIKGQKGPGVKTGALGPMEYLARVGSHDSTVRLFLGKIRFR